MNENKYKLSVRLMTYNHSKYICSAIEGILLQKTNFLVEVVIGDDFSTDDTLDKIKKYKDSDNIHFKILNRKEGGDYWTKRKKLGRLYNFLNIIEKCSGKYIALLDGDDYWTDPLKLQKQVDFLEYNPEYDITFHDTSVQDEAGKIIAVNRLKTPNSIRTQKELVSGAHLPTNTILFRNILKIPNEILKVKNGDTFLIALIGHKGKGHRHFDIANSVYRVHSEGIWSRISSYEKFMNGNYTFEQILKVSDKIYHKSLFRKLRSINYNLLKKAPNINSRWIHFKKMIYYSFMFLTTK